MEKFLGRGEEETEFRSIHIDAACLKNQNIEWGAYLKFRLEMAVAKTENEKNEIKRRYLKKCGLTSYSSQTLEVKEEKLKDPLCPNGHVMNFEPMVTLEELQPIITKLEGMHRVPPGTLLNGMARCIGKNGTCGRNLAEISYGWHVCTHRPNNECNYFMRCKDCFILEIAEPQDLL